MGNTSTYVDWTTTGDMIDEVGEAMKQEEKQMQDKFRAFVVEMSKLLEDDGIPANTVGFVNAIDIKAPRFDKDAVIFFAEYPMEVKDRILTLIQNKYQELLENSLGTFMRLYSQLYGQALQKQQQMSYPTLPQYTWSTTTTTSVPITTGTIVGTSSYGDIHAGSSTDVPVGQIVAMDWGTYDNSSYDNTLEQTAQPPKTKGFLGSLASGVQGLFKKEPEW